MPNLIFDQIEDQKQSVLETIKANLNGKNLSINGLSKLCTVADTSIVRGSALANKKLAETLTQHGFDTQKLVKEGFNAEATFLVLQYFAFESKVKSIAAYNLCIEYGIKPNKKKKTKKTVFEQKENAIRNKFFLNGDKREVCTKLGKIDLVTPTHLVEFKEAKSALHALGQVLCYHASFGKTEIKPTIVLFGAISEQKLSELRKVTTLNKVALYHFDGSQECFKCICHAIHSPEGKQKHGRYEVNTYKQTEQLDEVIQSYFR